MFMSITLLFVLLGLLCPFWGFVMVGVLLAVVRGNAALALALAAGMDLLYGPPIGLLHSISMPFVVGTLALLGMRYLLTRDMREDVPLTL